jgi:4-alpha-glucanotransferase
MEIQSMTRRAAGVFLHPTSLPSPFGIGDLGDDATRWLTLLKKYDHTYWQVCPLSPTGYGDSPYQSLSSFAGNPLLISPARLRDEGLLTQSELDAYPQLPRERVDYVAVIEAKDRLFRKAFARFGEPDEFGAAGPARVLRASGRAQSARADSAGHARNQQGMDGMASSGVRDLPQFRYVAVD